MFILSFWKHLFLLKKHFNPDNTSQAPAFCLVREKKNKVKWYVHNFMEAFP